jgi:hypothetical protein
MHASPAARLQPYERLHIVPVTLRVARTYVDQHHRHLPAPRGAKLAIAVRDTRGQVRGVAILGRPVSRHLDDGSAIEVTRVATDGCRNARTRLRTAVHVHPRHRARHESACCRMDERKYDARRQLVACEAPATEQSR